MKYLTPSAIALALLFAIVSDLRAQDSELGALPPLPDLDLGDPDRKLSWRDKREISRKESAAEQEESVYRRTSEDQGRATLGQRLSTAKAEQSRRKPVSNEITVINNLPSTDDGITASGSRLKAFGDEDRWANMPGLTPEEALIDLPPLPDLRTPDQVTKKERVRDLLVAKQEKRKAEADAIREQKELRERAVVNRPMTDPSTALVQVESQQMGGAGYVGNQEAPTKMSEGTLKPFNETSSYYRDNQLVYKGRKNETPAETWWRRGTNEPGGTNEPSGTIEPGGSEGDAPKWRWRNPFGESQDEVQPVSYTLPEGRSAHSAGAANPTLDTTPLTSNLQGIRVVKSTSAVSKGGLGSVSGVITENVELPARVYNVLSARVGGALTLGSLNQMVREAVVAYRKSDLPVVDVLVPEQEISSGVLQLVIIEGRLGDVLVEGAGNTEGPALASQIRTGRGEVIRESDLTEDMNWINKHPNRQVDLVFSPGDGYGETDVILRTQSTNEISGYVALENSGTSALGEARGIFGASWTGPLFFGMDSILSYQFTTNFDAFSDLQGHSGVFASYLPWRHQVTLLGAYVDSEAIFGNGGGATFNSGGVNKQLTGRYGIPLPSIGRLSHELELGMDFKTSNSDLAFNNARVFDTTSEIVQYSLGYNIVARDRTGAWRVDSEVVSSPGNNTVNNTDAIFQSQRAGSTANYTYGHITLERDQQLSDGWSAYGRVQGQGSNANLLASETLGAGGFDSVRGFEQRVVNGDSGVVGSVELRTPSFYPSTFAGFGNVRDNAYGLVFYDVGALSNNTPLPGEEDLEVSGVGLGFRYQRENWFTLRVDYGFQVTEEGFDDGNQGRWHVGARATF